MPDDFEAFREGFLAGFEVSREGFNGECGYEHCAPSVDKMRREWESVQEPTDGSLIVFLDNFARVAYAEYQRRRIKA